MRRPASPCGPTGKPMPWLSRRKVLEAISCAQNMTGAATVQLGIRAMQQAER